MQQLSIVRAGVRDDASPAIDVSIVMPCLNEAQSLPHCIANAREALNWIEERYGLSGEIVVADNGSTDGSQEMARKRGARVIDVPVRGYGAALIGGCRGAHGRYLLMGDADGSYDFTDGVAMIGRLMDGAGLCMGSRFQGGIAPGAMPWKNRYIGNPALTGILNLFYRARIDDAHCGLRAITREAFDELGLSGPGMEFASEMIVKAALKKIRIDQSPATLSVDLRERPPHLRPWRDGWRHLRYLLMLSPTWLFGVPGLLAMAMATVILGVASLFSIGVLQGVSPFGTSWTFVAGYLFTVGHFSLLMALATHYYGVRRGYRRLHPWLEKSSHTLTLESALISGAAMMTASLVGFAAIGIDWSSHDFAALPSILPLTLAAILGTTGVQTVLGGFLLAIIADHSARFAP
ncbi:MAG TPA: glycosyltransferase family 2 protein [Rhizomicrobium sp.]|jgi:hypothetical protein|nr:glycosyltransferase family 2 protein [Rhizomicrobium sp.]